MFRLALHEVIKKEPKQMMTSQGSVFKINKVILQLSYQTFPNKTLSKLND